MSRKELEKAEFFYDSVSKLDEISTRAYERNKDKIHIILGVLSTVIPLSTGVGYYILSSMFSLPFFLIFLLSLAFFVVALARGVLLLEPKWFLYVDVKMLIQRYEKKPLSFIRYKVSSTWMDTINKNISVINSLRSGIKQMVILIVIGLVLLIIAFLIIGIELYLMKMQNDPMSLFLL
jgi:hypothetical protein